jgi:hypothetical protein
MKYATLIVACTLFLLTLSLRAGTYVDTFDDRKLTDWKEVIVKDPRPGKWRVFNGEVRAESKDNDIRLLVLKDVEWTNYEVELDVMPLERDGRGHIVLAVRVTQTRAIVFTIGDIFWDAPLPIVTGTILNLETGNLDGLPLWFGARVNIRGRQNPQNNIEDILRVGVKLPCKTVYPHPFLKTDEWSHIKLKVSGDLFMLWVNDELVLTTICDIEHLAFLKGDLVVGSVGFGIAGYTTLFDNFVVTGEGIPNRGRLSVQPQDKLVLTWGMLKQMD